MTQQHNSEQPKKIIVYERSKNLLQPLREKKVSQQISPCRLSSLLLASARFVASLLNSARLDAAQGWAALLVVGTHALAVEHLHLPFSLLVLVLTTAVAIAASVPVGRGGGGGLPFFLVESLAAGERFALGCLVEELFVRCWAHFFPVQEQPF